ncbi:MAG: precorrin-2 dehydrogenase/sirohydrochlorin ferrochelatase family protein [Planctomycetota bacterium]|jgi:precorrin-2 dehydrogenase/sirohydrochlorin ferrochelatase
MLRFLPVGLDVRGRRCLIVGGGNVGTRKAGALQRAGADVTVVSPQLTDQLAAEAEAGRVRWVAEAFRAEHLGEPLLVIAATNDQTVNADVVREAARRGALVCDASSAERSQVIFAACLEARGVTVAVFTDGRDPALAARTRDRISALLGDVGPIR